MSSKVCSSCKVSQCLSLFQNNKSKSDGKNHQCKKCESEYRRSRYANIKDKASESRKKYYEKNREKINARNKRNKQLNPEKTRLNNEIWKDRNKDLVRFYYSKRRSSKKRAMPIWLSDYQLQEIKHFYLIAKEAEIMTGDRYEVDHIIPLQGKNVCGLHVPWNLQVLPRDMNRSKGNRTPYGEEEGLV
jgi:hypothetical protein